MKKKLFKYKIVTGLVYLYGFIMLFVFGFSTFDTYNIFQSQSSITPGVYFISAFLGLLFVLSLVSLLMVAIKSKISIIVLNIFYGFNILLFLGGLFINEFNAEKGMLLSDRLIILGLSFIPIILIFIINKFKSIEIQYENIDSIGTQND